MKLTPETRRIIHAVCDAKKCGYSDSEVGEAFLVAMQMASEASIKITFSYPRVKKTKKS